ncbi:MAG: insulinase family protein [Chloroflexi bacterium]|nr:insulinase family protein [Chloroflexota bacterium]
MTKNPPAARGTLPPVNFSEFYLDNGLRVILHEDRSTPIVAVNLWYHVGSKNEVRGRTGFAHLFEHMMFQGSKHYDADYFKPLQEAGGTLNGSTNADRTNYWETVPSNYMELALFLESDRMGFLLDAMTEEKLNNQRDVVMNEKRQNYDDRPYGLVPERIAATLYPPEHPYSWITIGSLEDIKAATIADVKDFFRRFYTPNNASLCLAGDFDRDDARQSVEKHFGSIPRGPEVFRVQAERARLNAEVRYTIEDRVTLPRVYLTWHTVAQMTEDDAALDILSNILVGTKAARIHRALVYEKQIAQDVSAFHNSRELGGYFQIVATAKPEVSIHQLEAAINEELEHIKREGATAEEIERAYNICEASFIYSIQTVGGFGSKSDQLNLYATFFDKPDFFAEDLARYRRVTMADIQSVAERYLTHERFVLSVVPQAPSATKAAKENAPTDVNTSVTPSPAPNPDAAAKQEIVPSKIETNDPLGLSSPAKTVAEASPRGGAAPTASVAHDISAAQVTSEEHASDRRALPVARSEPQFSVPHAEQARLGNGLEILFVGRRELPIININLVVRAAGAGDENQTPAGLASLTTDMLDEGAGARTSLEISETLAAHGSRLSTGAGWDAGFVQLLTLTRHLDSMLQIFGDVTARPRFPENDLERLKAKRLVAIRQRRDSAAAIADTVFARILYGDCHPYGYSIAGDEKSLPTITRIDAENFHARTFRPQDSTLIVVGDAELNALVPKLENIFSAWRSSTRGDNGSPDSINLASPLPLPDGSTLYLVDRPGSAQSVIVVGHIAAARSTPDYFSLLVLNTLLGGQFTSRLNMNLREDKGYTYGARTSFGFRRYDGPFAASASVQSEATRESVVEILKELRGVRGERPVTPDELEYAKAGITRGFPRGFEISAQIAERLSDAAVYDLPSDYFNNFIQRVRAVTLDDVTRAAELYLQPSRAAILVVGDRRMIEDSLRTIDGIGETLTLLDIEGAPTSGADD